MDTDAGQQDAIIAEGGLPGEEDGVAVALLYTIEGDVLKFEDEPAYVGPAPNFMAKLTQPTDEDAAAFEAAAEENFVEGDEEA